MYVLLKSTILANCALFFREPAFFDINATVYYSSPTGSWGNWVQDLHGYQWGFPRGSVVKSSPANAGDRGSILGLGRSPGEGNGNLPQCFCLENSMAKRAWRAAIHRVTKSHKVCSQLSNWAHTRVPRSEDAQVLGIKQRSTVGLAHPWVQDSRIERAD